MLFLLLVCVPSQDSVISSLDDEHLGLFRFEAMINNLARNIPVQLLLGVCIFISLRSVPMW